tara:strand:+ start:210 stop:809 length:600 start_codon:yes stop_codon:yes gene_type:complete
MCVPNNIQSLRRDACEVVQNIFVHPRLGSPLWCNPRFSEWKSQLEIDIEICSQNCLPISIAILGVISRQACNSNCIYRVVIGEVISEKNQPSLTKLQLSELYGIDEFCNTNWHAWVEVSLDHFETVNIIDLVYEISENQTEHYNFNGVLAANRGKRHVRILSDNEDIIEFYRRLRLTKKEASNILNAHMNTIINYIQQN